MPNIGCVPGSCDDGQYCDEGTGECVGDDDDDDDDDPKGRSPRLLPGVMNKCPSD